MVLTLPTSPTRLLFVESSTKVEIQLQDPSVKRTSEPLSMTVFPWMPYYSKCDILVWWSGGEDEELGIVISWYPLDVVGWCF